MCISHVASPYLHEQTMHTCRDTHSHMHTLTHAHTHTCTHAHTHTCTPMQTHTHAHTHTCTHMHTQNHTHAENELNIFPSSLLSLSSILSLLPLSPEHSGRSVPFQVMESSLLLGHIGSTHCTYGTRGLAPLLRCSLDRRGKPCWTLQ